MRRPSIFPALLMMTALAGAQDITFYGDVLPILQNRCQECHRAGQMAPMALTTFAEARPWAKAIREEVVKRTMPPWFADPHFGKFSNDRRLTDHEIDTLAKWAEMGSVEGREADAAPRRVWNEGWNLPRVDEVVAMDEPFTVPAKEPLQYQYLVIAADFDEDKWVQGVELRPSDRAVVHHAVVYIRPAGDTWKRGPTTNDILTVYAPGSAPDVFRSDMAKLIPAGADLVLEVHYTPKGQATQDRIEVGLMLAPVRPAKRVITLQMANTSFSIAPGAKDQRVTVWGTLPNDALLIGFFPHMHLRGKSFEYTQVDAEGHAETLLLVEPYDFYWQLSYRLAEPLAIKKGTKLNWIATYDNSAGNARNPDPAARVGYGIQSWDEMMVGFFDIAIDAGIDKQAFFVR
ncbi:MAG: thiol-disulfide isomerase [Acidobacteriota bacterium]